jgi:hypothetical protein
MSSYGLEPSWYLTSRHSPLTYQKEKQIREAIQRVGEKELEKVADDPDQVRKLLGLDWIVTARDIFKYTELNQKRRLEADYNNRYLHFLEVIRKKREKETENKKWKNYWLHVEVIYGKFKLDRLKKERETSLKKSFSEGNLSNSIAYFGEKKDFKVPPYPIKEKETRKIPKRDKKIRK